MIIQYHNMATLIFEDKNLFFLLYVLRKISLSSSLQFLLPSIPLLDSPKMKNKGPYLILLSSKNIRGNIELECKGDDLGLKYGYLIFYYPCKIHKHLDT